MMTVSIDENVHQIIDDFYEYAIRKHITLDPVTVIRKIQRIYDGLSQLGNYAFSCPNPRLRKDWLEKGYKECIIENFHFAFQVYFDEVMDVYYVYVHDACHSLLYRE